MSDKKTKAKSKDTLSFEEALEELESIVKSMENGDIPLADLISKYEEGSHYLKVCKARLKDAELKIEKLKVSDENTIEGFEVN
jgi:exodeoxyribonuclease VII small subunit